MRHHTHNISFGSVLSTNVIFLQNIQVANVIFACHGSAVVDIPKYGQCNRP